ncbi:trichohyalin-like [Saccostrea cucullata]|uniref:trichohyalin-like n=1 Tax=Saccostrea cuccullata TaxID=36930 RepID=UPI002ED4404A
MDSGRKKQFRFSEQDDIKLLREVISRNPFKERGKWADISSVISRNIDARRVRERTLLLIDQRKKFNSSSLKKSGVDETYGEKEMLLDEIIELANDEEEKKREDKSKAVKEESMCKSLRKRALENLTPSKSDEDQRNNSKMPRKCSSVISFLKEKAETEKQSRDEEFSLRPEQLNLEKERFELEKQERLQRLETEKQQTKMIQRKQTERGFFRMSIQR